MRSLRPLAVLLLLTACAPSAEPNCTADDGAFDAGDDWGLGFIDQELHLHAVSPKADCREPTAPFVELISPSTTSPPATILQSTHRPDGRLEVEFAFTPTELGLYQVHLTFQPDLGEKRGHVIVPALTTGTATTTVSMGTETCDAVSRLGDEFLCVAGTRATIWKAGQLVARFEGTAISAAGDVIWSVSPGGLEVRRDRLGAVTHLSAVGGFSNLVGFCEDLPDHGFRFDGRFLQDFSPSSTGLVMSTVADTLDVTCWYDDRTGTRVRFGGNAGGGVADLAVGMTGEAVWLKTGTAYPRNGTQPVDPRSTVQLDLPATGRWSHRAHWPVFEVEGSVLAPVLTPTPHWEAWPAPLLGLDDDVVFLRGATPGDVLMVRRPGR